MKCKKCDKDFKISNNDLVKNYMSGKKVIKIKCSCGDMNEARILLNASTFQEGIDSEIELEDEPLLDEKEVEND